MAVSAYRRTVFAARLRETVTIGRFTDASALKP